MTLAAFGVKLGLVAGAALVVLVPAFNSLNQVTVEDARPPFRLDDPPDLPPPDDLPPDTPPPDGPQPQSPQCPPPVGERVFEYDWTMPPQVSGDRESRAHVAPGAASLFWVGNISRLVGTFTFTLVPPGETEGQEVFRWDSTTDGTDRTAFTGELKGVVPGPWTARADVGPDANPLLPLTGATGHVDLQLYQVFPCGGAGRG